MQVTAQYVEGIKEGRTLFKWWQRDNMLTRELLTREIASLEMLRSKCVPLANSALYVDFFAGQLDFYALQLKAFDDHAKTH